VPEFKVSKTKFILPTAKSRPISLNRGMRMPGWSDIYGLDADSREDLAGFEESRDRINRIVEAEVARGIAPARIVLGGFSQGGALALHTVE
jgi:phospholipase/carboxylesterase